MKRLTLLVCFLAVALFSLRAHATKPTIGMGDPTCGPGDTSLAEAGGAFFFVNNTSGGGFFTFCNDTGQTILFADIKFANTPGYNAETNPIDCTSNVFLCDITYSPQVVDLFFSLGEEEFAVSSNSEIECEPGEGGIQVGCRMTINLNDLIGDVQCVPGGEVSCTGSWPTDPPVSFVGQVNGTADLPAVPEPASVLLVSSGFLALWRFRVRRT